MKIIDFFKKNIIIFTTVLCSIILYYCCFYVKNIPKISSFFRSPYIIFIFVFVVLSILLITIFKAINKANKTKEKIIKYSLFLILLLGQIFILLIYDVTQITDSYYIMDQAVNIGTGIEQVVNYEFYDYFINISNNNFLLLILTLIVKFLKLFSINNFTVGIAIFNMVFINFSIYFLYKFAREIKDEKFALKVLLLNILNPINYVFIYWFYTSTFCLPFTTLILYLAVLVKKNQDNKKSVLYSILLFFFAILGCLMRATTIIPFIAILFYLITSIKFDKKQIKKYCLNIILIILVSLTTYKGVNYCINKIAPNNSNSFPVTHFLMIGMNEEGRITNEAVNYTSSFDTKEEKVSANIEVIKEKLKEYKFSGFIMHTFKKLPITWEDGMSKFKPRLYQDKKNLSISNWISGEKSEIFAIYCQGFRILTFFFAIIGMIYLYKQRKEKDSLFMIVLTVFGAILFYLLWESKEDYNIQFLSIILLLSAYGLNNVELKTTKHKNIIFKSLLCFTIFLSVIFYQPLTQTKYTWTKNRVLAYNTNILEYEKRVYRDNSIIEQEFYTDDDFNYITIRALKRSNAKSKYNIILKDSKDKILKEFCVTANDIINGYITIDLNDIELNNNKYLLQIKSDSASYNEEYTDSIQWGYLNSRILKAYEGNMYLDGEKTAKELFIKVYEKSDSVFMNSKTYLILVSIIISSEVLIYIFMKRKEVVKNEKK